MEEKQRIVQVWDQAAHSFGRVGPRYWDRFGSRLVELSSIQEGSRNMLHTANDFLMQSVTDRV